MTESPNVSVVVVNWNGWQHTVRCLQSLATMDYPGYSVTVVDNGSQDGSVERIHAAFPATDVIETGANLGFAGGANAGIHAALDSGAAYVWLLNNDVEAEAETLSRLVRAAAAHERTGIVGPSVLRARGGEASMEPAAFVWRGEQRTPAVCPGPSGDDAFHLVDDLAGSSMLISSALLREIGLLEERFFHYWEDVEFCSRARKAGWLVGHACAARIRHVVGASVRTDSAQGQYYIVRNWLLFARWSGRGGPFTMLRRAPRMTLGRVLGHRWLLRGRWRLSLASMLGAVDGVRGRSGQRELPGWLR
jgi:GT2 family glycosyltransferase